MSPHILTERRDATLCLTLNKPKILNAWDAPMRRELGQLFKQAENDDTVRAVILTGAGARAFCAGQDLNEAQTFDSGSAAGWIDEWRGLYGAIRSLTKPSIMALNGVAAGSAFQLALLGDIRIGHPGVRMGQPEILSGLASITGPWIMREMMGHSRTVELALSGRMMSGDEAHRIGLIHHLVGEDEVGPLSWEVARELGSRPRIAMRETKQWLALMNEEGLQNALTHAAHAHASTFGSDETSAKLETFLARGNSGDDDA